MLDWRAAEAKSGIAFGMNWGDRKKRMPLCNGADTRLRRYGGNITRIGNDAHVLQVPDCEIV